MYGAARVPEEVRKKDFDTKSSTESAKNANMNKLNSMKYGNQENLCIGETKTACTENDNDKLEDIEEIIMNKKKRVAVIESDSDDFYDDDNAEMVLFHTEKDSNEENDNEQFNKTNKCIASDSEHIEAEQEKELQQSSKSKPIFKLIDSESEDENAIINEEPELTLNDGNNLFPETDKTMEESLAALCDPEFSGDEEKQMKPLAYKRKKNEKNNEEPHDERRMTAKEAMDQRTEIESESQRMLRDSHVALPYHKPRQRNLKDFLKNRPRFASSVPAIIKNVSAAASIKMTREHLEIISNKMIEREKQVAEFYKSESDDDEEEAVDVEKRSFENTGNDEDNESEKNNVINVAKDVDAVDENTNIENDEQISKLTANEKEKQDDTILDIPDTNKVDILKDQIITVAEMDTATSTTTQYSKTCDKNITIENTPRTTENNLDKNCSVEYEFNLDDSDEEQDSREPVTDTSTETNVMGKTKLELLKSLEKLGNIQPKLSGAPNYIIDLEDNTTKPNEITELMNRFMQHTKKKPQHKHSAVELSITCVSPSGNIHKENVAVKVEDNEVPLAVEKPGVKLQKLRYDLQVQMAQKRNESWHQKQQMKKEQIEELDAVNDIYKDEKDDCGVDDILDDEEEEFSGSGDSSDSENDDENEDEYQELLEEEGEGNLDKDADIPVPNIKMEKKQLKRILQPVDSDEDSSDVGVDQASRTLQMDSTVSWGDDDDFVPAGQTNRCHTPIKQPGAQSKSELGFLSPVCRLTGLQSFDATGKFLMNSPGSPAIKLGDPSPLKTDGWAKSLFPESPSKNCDNIEEICSGTFATPRPVSAITAAYHSQEFENNEPTTQDLLALCSGNFNDESDTHLIIIENEAEKNRDEDKDVVENRKEKGCVVDVKERKMFEGVSTKIVGSSQLLEEQRIDEEDDRLISQLIDEEELEIFRKKFDSPIIELQRRATDTEGNKSIATKICFDIAEEDKSDDEDEMLNIKRKKKNKIVDSDEEELANDAEEIDLHDDIDENEDEEGEEDLVKHDDTELGYDSEENEIIVVKPKKKMLLKNFVENEAELSESEWGSEDEDEGNLDQMEMEEGDTEKYDQNKLRRDLEKIHMRHMLDTDKRHIKVLQEIYLGEDEELQGAGRQRQFRWRNNDNVDNEESTTNNRDDSTLNQDEEEDDNEEEWRKRRFERELYLHSQKRKSNEDGNSTNVALATNSQVLKLGQRAVIQNKSVVIKHVTTKQPYTTNNPRGSFLARKDEVLTRVAEYTKVSDKVLGTSKNSRNFVFQSISTKTSSESEGNSSTTSFDDKKRKAADGGTPVALKRLRLTGLSPANQKKADKKSKARLFSSNW